MFRLDTTAIRGQLGQLHADVEATVQQALGQAAAFALALATNSEKFQDRTGRLRASMRRGRLPRGGYFVRAGDRRSSYAGVVEDGSKPHVIMPKRGNVLRFVAGGQVHFARRVHHPGTKPAHYMLDARNASEQQLGRFVRSGLSQLFR